MDLIIEEGQEGEESTQEESQEQIAEIAEAIHTILNQILTTEPEVLKQQFVDFVSSDNFKTAVVDLIKKTISGGA